MHRAQLVLPRETRPYYGGQGHDPLGAQTSDSCSPATGEKLACVAEAGIGDVDRIVAAAKAGYQIWRDIAPLERARLIRELAAILRRHADELALLDATD